MAFDSRQVLSYSARIRLALAGFAALISLAALPALASAEALVPGGNSEMSLVFSAESAHLVGSSALVPVKCLGSGNGLCNGTVTLTVKGAKHKVPFALVGGSAQTLEVPVGSAGGLSGATAVAVARTQQAVGGYSRATGVLHLH